MIFCHFFFKKNFHKKICVNFLTFEGRKEEKYIIDFEEKFLNFFWLILIVIFRYFMYKFKTFGGFRGFGVWMSGFGFCSGISFRGRVRVGDLKVEVVPLGFQGFGSLTTSLYLTVQPAYFLVGFFSRPGFGLFALLPANVKQHGSFFCCPKAFKFCQSPLVHFVCSCFEL